MQCMSCGACRGADLAVLDSSIGPRSIADLKVLDVRSGVGISPGGFCVGDDGG